MSETLQNPNTELYNSRVVRYGSVLLCKLMILLCHSCTPMPGGSPAVLVCIQRGCPRLWGQCPSLPGEVGVGQKPGGRGPKGDLGHSPDGWRGGRGRLKKF